MGVDLAYDAARRRGERIWNAAVGARHPVVFYFAIGCEEMYSTASATVKILSACRKIVLFELDRNTRMGKKKKQKDARPGVDFIFSFSVRLVLSATTHLRVRDLERELFLDGHDDFDDVQRVEAQVLEARLRRDHRRIDLRAQPLSLFTRARRVTRT